MEVDFTYPVELIVFEVSAVARTRGMEPTLRLHTTNNEESCDDARYNAYSFN